MPQRVEDVVAWKARTAPDRQVIPRHLKLAILSRGRIDVPTQTIGPIVDEALRRGAHWPGRLTMPLTRIFPEVHLVLELFQIQRAGMTPDQIDETVVAYLLQRKAQHYPKCAVLEWSRTALRSSADRRVLERALGLDLTRLFGVPQVRLPTTPRAPRYLLLAYFCLPSSINQYLRADPRLTEPLLPSPVFDLPTRLDSVPPMPSLEGRTDPRDELHVRKSPNTGADSLGVLGGHEAKVRVLEKFNGKDAGGAPLLWFKIEMLEDLSVTKKPVSDGPSRRFSLQVGTTGWVAAGGIKVAAAPWRLFRRELRKWEASLPFMSPVADRITALRQMSHRAALPFDEVIGSPGGKKYKDDLKYAPDVWQMFRDYEAIVAPDGRWVDLQHLLVGLDALARPEKKTTKISRALTTLDIGSSWAAATWAGDLGSAVADSQTQGTGPWASYARPRTKADYMDFFLQANAPDWDLLGDLDPWGIRPILSERSDVKTVDDLLSLYYEDLVQPILDLTASPGTGCPFNSRPIVRRRLDALTRFLVHYGFRFPPSGERGAKAFRLFVDPVRMLAGQPGEKRIARDIGRFAVVWFAFRSPIRYKLSPTPPMSIENGQAVRYFLDWLALESMMHCVRTHEE